MRFHVNIFYNKQLFGMGIIILLKSYEELLFIG